MRVRDVQAACVGNMTKDIQKMIIFLQNDFQMKWEN